MELDGFLTITGTLPTENVANLSGINTGDQNLSGYQTTAGTLALGGFSSITGTIAISNIGGLGTGVGTALSAATNGTGGFTTIDGTATLTNKSIDAGQLTGNIAVARIATALTTPGAIGATTPSTGAFTTLTASGASSFTSTTRPTSSGTGTPAATSLITRDDGDARYGGARTVYTSSAQIDSTTNTSTRQDVTGCTGISIDANGLYLLEVYGETTHNASSAYLSLESSAAFSPNTNYSNNSLGFMGGTAYNGGFQNSTTWIDFVAKLATTTGTFKFQSRMILKTSNASTMKLTFSQSSTVANTTSLLSGVKLFVTKLN